jgi:hypothetical protein
VGGSPGRAVRAHNPGGPRFKSYPCNQEVHRPGGEIAPRIWSSVAYQCRSHNLVSQWPQQVKVSPRRSLSTQFDPGYLDGSCDPFKETSRDSDIMNSPCTGETVSRLARISPPSASAAILAALCTSPRCSPARGGSLWRNAPRGANPCSRLTSDPLLGGWDRVRVAAPVVVVCPREWSLGRPTGSARRDVSGEPLPTCHSPRWPR